MADEFDEFRVPLKASAAAAPTDEFDEFRRPLDTSPGGTPENSINEMHPDLSTGTRELIKLLQTNPAQGLRKLKEEGFEAKHVGGWTGQYDYSLRKPGGKWYRVDPSGWQGFGELLRDALEAGEDVLEGTAVGTATAGAAALAAPTTPLGMAAAGATAGGATAAGISGAKSGLGRLFGLGTTGGEALEDAAISGATGAVLGGVPQVVGPRPGAVSGLVRGGLHKAGGILQKPEQQILEKSGEAAQAAFKEAGNVHNAAMEPIRQARKAHVIEGKEIAAAQQGTLQELAAARGAYQTGPQAALQGARTEEVAARAAHKAAAMADQSDLIKRVAASKELAEKLIKEGRELAGANLNVSLQEGVKKTASTGGKLTINIPYEIARADYGITAAALQKLPEVGAIGRKWFGDTFIPVFAETGEKLGSWAMPVRNSRLRDFARQMGAEAAEKAGTGWSRDMAALMLTHPAFKGNVPEKVLQNLAKAARGEVTDESATEVMKALSMRLTGRAVSPELAATTRTLNEKVLARLRATQAARQSTEAARHTAAQTAHDAQLAAGRQVRGRIQKEAAELGRKELAARAPYAEARQTLDDAMRAATPGYRQGVTKAFQLGAGAVGAALGGIGGGPVPGAALGATLAILGSPKLMNLIGLKLQRIAAGEGALARRANTLLRAARGGKTAFKAALYLSLRQNPDLARALGLGQ